MAGYRVVKVPDLRVGDAIVTKWLKSGGRRVPFGSKEVREVVHNVRGCRNTHVNGDECYDSIATVAIMDREVKA